MAVRLSEIFNTGILGKSLGGNTISVEDGWKSRPFDDVPADCP